jgi:hypothetical protein
MPSLGATLFFVVFPIGASAASAIVALNSLAELKARGQVSSPEVARSRVMVLWASTATVPVYGLVLWLQAAGKEGTTILAPRDFSLLDWTAIVWAWLSGVTVGVQTWIVKARMAALLGPAFGRILVFVTLSLAPIVFFLVVALQILGRLPLAQSVSETKVNSIVTALTAWAMCALALPAATSVANRIEDLMSPRNFFRAIRLSDLGLLPTVAAFGWALLQVGSL